MTEPQQVDWPGASGAKYTYYVYPLPANLKDEEGNYIYTKLENNKWVPVYIGQGNLKERGDINDHHQSQCLKNKGVTHIHAHLNPNKTSRLTEEDDLLANYPMAYKPTGCNEKPGG